MGGARKRLRMKIHFALLFALESSLVAANLCAKCDFATRNPTGRESTSIPNKRNCQTGQRKDSKREAATTKTSNNSQIESPTASWRHCAVNFRCQRTTSERVM